MSHVRRARVAHIASLLAPLFAALFAAIAGTGAAATEAGIAAEATDASSAADGSAAASGRPIDQVLDGYVNEAFAHNLGLQAASLDVERSQAALDAARARFLPELSLDARYTRASGGRVLDFPIGQLLNPVYSTLNDLLVANGQPGNFPQIADQQIPFLRSHEQDSALNLRQPLYAPAIPAALRAQKAALAGSEYARLALARRLKRDLTVAYLGWLQASNESDIVAAGEQLLTENLRVNQSLFDNGKVTEDRVLRARAELLAIQQQLRAARNGVIQAQDYVNFLMNRPLDTALEGAVIDGELAVTRHDLEALRRQALSARPERGQIASGLRAAEAQVDVARAARKPTLSFGATGGTQGETYRTGEGSNYSTLSLLLSWNLFDGGRRHAEANAARASARALATQSEALDRQIELEVRQALDALETSADSQATAEARVAAARAGFRIATRKRDEGAINQAEFIDARNALTSAELNLNSSRFGMLARRAELDYAVAAGTLPAFAGNPVPAP